MKQGLRDGLKHVLEGTDTGKTHRKIEDNREEPSERNVLQNGRQRDKQEAGARADVQVIGEAGRDNDERRDKGRNRVENCRVLAHCNDILVL